MFGSLTTVLTMAMVAAQSRKAVFYTKPLGFKRKGSAQTNNNDANLAMKSAGLNITTHRVPKPDFTSAQLHVLGAKGKTYRREDADGGCARVLALSLPGSGSTWLWGLLNARASTQIIKDLYLGPLIGSASGGSGISTAYAPHTSPTQRLLKLLECTADGIDTAPLMPIDYDVRGAVISPVIGAPLVNWTRVSMHFGGMNGGLRIVKFVRTNVVKAAITLVRRKDHAVYNGAPNIRYGTSSSSHHKTYFAEADLALALAFIAQQRIQLDILLGTSALSSPTLVQQQRRKSRRLSNRHGKGDHGGSSSSSSSGRQHPEAENNPTSMLSSTSWAQLAASTTAAAGVTSSAPRSTDASLSNTEGSKDLGFKDPFEQLTPAPKVEHLLASATAAPRPWIGHLRGTLDGQGHIRRTPQSREHNVYVLRYEDLQRDERGTIDDLYQWLGRPAVAEKVREEATGKKTSDDLREIVQNLGAVSRFFDEALALPAHADCPLLLMFTVQAPRVFRDCDFWALKKHSRKWLAKHWI